LHVQLSEIPLILSSLSIVREPFIKKLLVTFVHDREVAAESSSLEEHIETSAVVVVFLAIHKDPIIISKNVSHRIHNRRLNIGRRVEDLTAQFTGGSDDYESIVQNGQYNGH